MKLPTFAADCQALLEAFEKELEALGIDLPDSRYVAEGIVAWDGPSLTIYLGEIIQGQPGQPFGGTFQPGDTTVTYAVLQVQILREAPALSGGGTAGMMTPDADELGAAGLQALGDAGALVLSAIRIHQANEVTGAGEGFAIGPCQPLGPEGGLSGMRLALSLSLA